MSAISNSPTLHQVTTLNEGFNLLNKHLFDSELPPVIINQEHKKSPGYFSPNRWKAKEGANEVHEINLTPYSMNGNSKLIISELLREMVHLWQHTKGKAPSPGYHNKQWAEKMISVGLQPASVKNPGKMTGQKVTHSIISGGPFDKLINESSFQIKYYSVVGANKKRNKLRYTCSGCGIHVWGKPGLNITCGNCNNPFAEDKEEANG